VTEAEVQTLIDRALKAERLRLAEAIMNSKLYTGCIGESALITTVKGYINEALDDLALDVNDGARPPTYPGDTR